MMLSGTGLRVDDLHASIAGKLLTLTFLAVKMPNTICILFFEAVAGNSSLLKLP